MKKVLLIMVILLVMSFVDNVYALEINAQDYPDGTHPYYFWFMNYKTVNGKTLFHKWVYDFDSIPPEELHIDGNSSVGYTIYFGDHTGKSYGDGVEIGDNSYPGMEHWTIIPTGKLDELNVAPVGTTGLSQDFECNFTYVQNGQKKSVEIISPQAGKLYVDEKPDLQVMFNGYGDTDTEIGLYKQNGSEWEQISTEFFYVNTNEIGYLKEGDTIPYVTGHLKIEIQDVTSDETIGTVLGKVEFDYKNSNDNIVDIVGIMEGKEYSVLPNWQVVKTGIYKPKTVEIWINDKYMEDVAAGVEVYQYPVRWFDNATGEYRNEYRVGDNKITIKDKTTGTVLKEKKFVLLKYTEWDDDDWAGNSDLVMPGDIIKDKFPFCIPFDLANSIKSLKRTPVAPKWTVSFPSTKFVGGGSFVIDFSQFETLAKIVRWGTLLLFVYGLIIVTRRLIGD